MDSMIEPFIDEVQLALLAMQITEKLLSVAHSEDPMTPALKRVIIEGSRAILRAIRT